MSQEDDNRKNRNCKTDGDANCRPQTGTAATSSRVDSMFSTQMMYEELVEEEEMPQGRSRRRVNVPEELREALLKFSIAYVVEGNGNVIDYAVDYFLKLQENRRRSEAAIQRNELPRSSSGSVLSQDEDASMQQQFARRKSVFAEPYDPEEDSDEDELITVIYPKTDEQRTRLTEAVKNVLLFRSLEKDQLNQVLDAMFVKRVQPGEYIIRQGDNGDNFYVIESGIYGVYKDDVHIQTYNNSGIFGELALLYSMPRPTSIQAQTEGLLWVTDRQTFRRILLKSAFKKRKMYESLLDNVPMLQTLQNYERMNLADALVSKYFEDKESIFKQGDPADGMYFVEEGNVSVRMEQNQEEVEIANLGKGEHFGELALVTHRPRAASVYANGPVKVAFLETAAFERILGFLTDVLKRNATFYEEHLTRLARNSVS